MKSYDTFIFENYPEWEIAPVVKISSFHWEGQAPYRPLAFAQLCMVASKGIFARLWCVEDSPRSVCIKRDEPVYEDSCLELFLRPFQDDENYVNIECNSGGVFLSQFGQGRNGRTFISALTSIAPIVTPFAVCKNSKNAWGAEIFLSIELISSIYNRSFETISRKMFGNFYKCGDLTQTAHYGAFFPVGSIQQGFHNPEKFGSIVVTPYKK